MIRLPAFVAVTVAGVAFTAAAVAHAATGSSVVLNPAPAAALGATVTYTASYPGGTKNPVIESDCYQNGTLVWAEVDSASAAATSGVLLGGSWSPWETTAGPAGCAAHLQSRFWKAGVEQVVELAATSFTATG